MVTASIKIRCLNIGYKYYYKYDYLNANHYQQHQQAYHTVFLSEETELKHIYFDLTGLKTMEYSMKYFSQI